MLRLILNYYKFHIGLFIFLLLGLIIGVSLLVGVLALTNETEKSFADDMKKLDQLPWGFIRGVSGENIDESFFVELRTSGVTHIAPVLRGAIRVKSSRDELVTLEAIGIDLLSLPGTASYGSYLNDETASSEKKKNSEWDWIELSQFMASPYQLFVSHRDIG